MREREDLRGVREGHGTGAGRVECSEEEELLYSCYVISSSQVL